MKLDQRTIDDYSASRTRAMERTWRGSLRKILFKLEEYGPQHSMLPTTAQIWICIVLHIIIIIIGFSKIK